jgi:hypothetical protein
VVLTAGAGQFTLHHSLPWQGPSMQCKICWFHRVVLCLMPLPVRRLDDPPLAFAASPCRCFSWAKNSCSPLQCCSGRARRRDFLPYSHTLPDSQGLHLGQSVPRCDRFESLDIQELTLISIAFPRSTRAGRSSLLYIERKVSLGFCFNGLKELIL